MDAKSFGQSEGEGRRRSSYTRGARGKVAIESRLIVAVATLTEYRLHLLIERYNVPLSSLGAVVTRKNIRRNQDTIFLLEALTESDNEGGIARGM